MIFDIFSFIIKKRHLKYEARTILFFSTGTNALLIFLKQSNRKPVFHFCEKSLLLDVVVCKMLNREST